MDKQVIALLIPIFALAIPIVAVVMHGFQKIWRLRVEEARVRAERLDFTELILTQDRERPRLPGGTER